MKKLFLLFVLLLISKLSIAERTLYVNNFNNILGNTYEENKLLNYSSTNKITSLLLYDLYNINLTHNLSDTNSNIILANFIKKAKTEYNIVKVGATAENKFFFENTIHAYNTSRENPNEKFDIYNLEFEYWNALSVEPGSNFCTDYLIPNGLSCDTDGGFMFFISVLQKMDSLAESSVHPIQIEAYVGLFTDSQANIIGNNLDRLLIHAYTTDPNDAFDYTKERLEFYSNAHPNSDVSIIFSAEDTFMNYWLESNSMQLAEDTFKHYWQEGSINWGNNVNLTGFTYFKYTDMDLINLTDSLELLDTFIAVKEIELLYTNSDEDILYIKNIKENSELKLYSYIGNLIVHKKGNLINLSTIPKGYYILKIQSNNKIITKRIFRN